MNLGRTLMSLLMGWRKATATGPAPSTLLNDLYAYWPLNEVSGVRYDAVGDNDLSDINTVTSKARGPAGAAAKFVAANTESLSRASTIGTFGSGVSQTFSFWWKDTSAGAVNGAIIARDNATTREWAIYTGNTVLYFLAFDSGGNPYTLDSFTDFTDTFAKNVWHHGLVWYDASDGKQYYQVDGGTVRSKAGIDYIKSGTGPLQIGASTYYAAADLTLGNVAIWNRVLTSDERTATFASGNGLRYADLPADLLTNLVSYWDLNEPSGVRYDSHGSNDLTDNNTVLNTSTGPLGLVASPVKANSETLSVNDTADLSGGVGKSYTFSLWVKPATVAGASDHGIFCKGTASTATLLEYFLEQYEDDLYWYVGNATTASYATKAAKIAAEVWAHIICGFDASTGKGFLSVDNDAQTLSGQLPGDAMLDGTGAFAIGRYGTNVYWGGQIATFGVWSRVLTADERTSLYNGGRGVRHAELPAGLTSGIVSYWDLNEASGVRYDSAGANNLTDNNTVLSTVNAGDAADGVTAIFVAANSEALLRTAAGGATGPAPLGGFTASFWYKPTTPVGDRYLAWGEAPVWQFYAYAANTLRLYLYKPGGTSGVVQATTRDGEWNHIVGWYDPATDLIYIQSNGGSVVNLAAPFASTVIDSPTRWVIGGNASVYSNSQIDEVAIWDRVLTADERAELFALGRGKYYDFT